MPPMPPTSPTSDPVLTEAHRHPDDSTLQLAWTDGHRASYDYAYLRGYCPCASCQGHTAQAIRFHRPAGEVTAEEIEPVGNYAISIRWSDGHATGIYRYGFLRQICPCDECVAERSEVENPPPVPR